VIFPVPVTLKRFLALEFVLTFGIPVKCYLVKPLRRPAQAGTYRASSGNSIPQIPEWGRKDRDEKAKMPPCSGLNFKNPVKIPLRTCHQLLLLSLSIVRTCQWHVSHAWRGCHRHVRPGKSPNTKRLAYKFPFFISSMA
jgi:hypothetical protein